MYRQNKIYDVSYHNFLGSWAWLLHRLSGLALIFYLTLHIWVISHLAQGAESFNAMMDFLNTPLFKILEVGLWGVILFHAFNGLRVAIVDFGHGALAHKKWFVILIGFAFLLWAAGSAMILMHIGG